MRQQRTLARRHEADIRVHYSRPFLLIVSNEAEADLGIKSTERIRP